ncbi:MAG: hypothetical protein N2504_06605 [candidate division WOR-3 bacterium]|nr:hypothetical protein [candidate division WOR-3 bacterium]MCX7948237.1 hypothetical protein [candidate division WOR-3 bacterium]MDW8150039.1 hypothetical protein [candidate division WOR-3 bacterium]
MKKLIAITSIILVSKLYAHERLFTYSYDTDYLPQGLFEVEQWVTLKSGKEKGIYNLWDMRTEFEYAITPKTHVALYLNYSSLFYQYYEDGQVITHQSSKFKGVDVAIVHRLSNPRQILGFGLYGELKYRMYEYEFEEKLLLSKYLLSEKVLTTLNIIFEQKLENEYNENGKLDLEKEAILMIPIGIAYKFSNFALGIEAWTHSEWKDKLLPSSFNQAEHNAFFLGPVFHYSNPKFWITLTFTPQITNVLDEHEKLEARMIFSIIF